MITGRAWGDPARNSERAIALLRSKGRATLRELAKAEALDVSGGPPFPAGHPIYELAADLAACGARRIDKRASLDMVWKLSATQRAAKGLRP